MLKNVLLLKYISSFSEGRVRLRHPALRRAPVAELAKSRLSAVHGVKSVECNPVTGSALILYDSKVLSQDDLIAAGVAWAQYLDAVQAGKQADIPVIA